MRHPISGARPDPPWDFFHDASIASLQSFELSRLNHAANLRREIAALLDQWVNDNSQALLARWVREQRSLQAASPSPTTLPPATASPAPTLGPAIPAQAQHPSLPFDPASSGGPQSSARSRPQQPSPSLLPEPVAACLLPFEPTPNPVPTPHRANRISRSAQR